MGFNPYPANVENMLSSLIFPANGRWDLTRILLTWRIWLAPNNARKWQMGFNPYPANVENMVSS